ncbi:MAG: DEAD/DEAH box helicase family protein [Oscillibacter sp.]|nr:DEAD/DEAH box helicase family protein [Oscillibacter sp.]
MASRLIGPHIHPIIHNVHGKATVSDLLHDLLPTFDPSNPILLQAGTGAGKTRSILDVLVPYAVEHDQKILFISSRAAISTQFKTNLARVVKRPEISTDYTAEGLRKVEDIDPVKILTYHALWAQLCAGSINLRSFDYLVWDEIHSLALDSVFVAYTGELLERVVRSCAGICRIYLSATPEPILDKLVQLEGYPALTVYRWTTRYDHFLLHFYGKLGEIADYMRNIPAAEKALIFVSSIREGEILAKMLPDDHRLITSSTRTNLPDEWTKLLSDPILPTRFTIATTTLDAGVSLTDPALKHIVCESLDFAQILQEAGRKRLKTGEKLNIYLRDPTRQQIGNRLIAVQQTLTNLAVCATAPNTFVRRFILGSEQPELRGMCCSSQHLCCAWDSELQCFYNGPETYISLTVNPLSALYLQQRTDLFTQLLKRGEEYPFEKYICKCFGQPLPSDSSRWLDGRFDAANRDKFWNFVKENIGKIFFCKKEKELFSAEFQALHTAAYGPRKADRSDRIWGANIIKNVLEDHNRGYQLDTKRGWQIIDLRQQSA